jgi:hypothetical protein
MRLLADENFPRRIVEIGEGAVPSAVPIRGLAE